jgi:signal transduction histidine kinase
LRTPMTSIQGFAEFLMRYPEAAQKSGAAETIFRESRRLVALINTYLDVLRMDAGHRPLQREIVDVGEMISQVQRIMEPLAEAAESRVTVRVESQLPRLAADANLLAGVLLNLLNNGVKYSPRGSEVRLQVTRAGENIVFEVSNPGSPIPADDLNHLFDAYYRGREDKGPERGWGLGLAFVKRIAESHGGRVEATSDASATILRVIVSGAMPNECGSA